MPQPPSRPPRSRGAAKAREEVSAGGVVVRRESGRVLYLLIRDSYKHWGFPKGHLETGEEASAAALREVGEETGLRALTLRAPIDTIDWSFRFRGRLIHKTCHFFLIETRERRTAPRRDEGISACRWATYEQAASMVAYDNARAVLEGARRLVEQDVGPMAPHAPDETDA